jgi:hypothetical protein
MWRLLRWQVNTVRRLGAVIEANPGSESGAGAGIQNASGCRIKSGMTNYLIAGSTGRSLLIITVLFTLLEVFGSWSCSKGGYSGKVESINFGTVPTAASALIYIAQDQHFFAANRLSINIKDYNTGTATTEALLKGDMNISWVAEFPKDEAQWMIKNNLTTEKSIPDFVNYIYVDGLKAVKPEAVSIIR